MFLNELVVLKFDEFVKIILVIICHLLKLSLQQLHKLKDQVNLVIRVLFKRVEEPPPNIIHFRFPQNLKPKVLIE